MIKHLLSLTFLLTALSFGSCKKETTPEEPKQIANHINFKVDGVTVELEYKILLQDPVFNAYYKQGKSLSMQRHKENANTQRIIFAVDRIDLENETLPITINYSTDLTEPTVSVTYVDEDDMPFGTNTNNGQDFSVTINSYDDQVINCSFSGSLFSGVSSNPKVDITEGDLNLELVEY